jgi:hypothetical protein
MKFFNNFGSSAYFFPAGFFAPAGFFTAAAFFAGAAAFFLPRSRRSV